MSDPRKFKNDIVVEGDIALPSETANRALIIDGSGEIASSVVTSTELELLSGATVDLADLEQDVADLVTLSGVAANSTDLGTFTGAIIPDASDNKEALQALETFAGTDAQNLADHIADASDAHDASAISNVPSGNLAATDLQGAVNELQSDIDTRALDSAVIKHNGSVAFTADQSMGGNQLTNVGAPSASTDAATKGYVDSVAEGLKPKAAVRAATLVAGVLLTSFEDGDVIDGVTLATGDRILIKDQVLASENGIYIVEASGAPTRAPDFDSLSPIDEINGAYTFIQEGTQAGQGWVQTGVVATIDVDDINFVYFNSVAALVGGDGITVAGNNISVDHDGQGLTFSATQLALELDGATLSKSASGLKLGDTAVTPGSFGSATETVTFTVDQQGRLTAASEQSIAIPASQVTDFNEAAQDAVGTILTDTDTVQLVYTDGGPTIEANVLYQMSITSDASGLMLDGDEASPGNTQYYGTDGSGVKGFHSIPSQGSPGDIQQTSFSAADSQAVAADVTGFAFANGSVRAFTALVSVSIDGTSDLFEEFTLQGIQKSASWNMSVDSVGDNSGITFSITSAGQVQYTSGTVPGFVSNTMKFRAWVTNV